MAMGRPFLVEERPGLVAKRLMVMILWCEGGQLEERPGLVERKWMAMKIPWCEGGQWVFASGIGTLSHTRMEYAAVHPLMSLHSLHI